MPRDVCARDAALGTHLPLHITTPRRCGSGNTDGSAARQRKLVRPFRPQPMHQLAHDCSGMLRARHTMHRRAWRQRPHRCDVIPCVLFGTYLEFVRAGVDQQHRGLQPREHPCRCAVELLLCRVAGVGSLCLFKLCKEPLRRPLLLGKVIS